MGYIFVVVCLVFPTSHPSGKAEGFSSQRSLNNCSLSVSPRSASHVVRDPSVLAPNWSFSGGCRGRWGREWSARWADVVAHKRSDLGRARDYTRHRSPRANSPQLPNAHKSHLSSNKPEHAKEAEVSPRDGGGASNLCRRGPDNNGKLRDPGRTCVQNKMDSFQMGTVWATETDLDASQ